MIGTAHDGVVDWLMFVHEGKRYEVNLTFLMSNWQCIYGQGCPGMFGRQQSNTFPDIGCCTHGFWVSNDEDEARAEANIALLTDDDWDKDLRAHVERKGWKARSDKEPDGWRYKSRVIDGGCVFANRNGGSSGQPGCAFLALARRKGRDTGEHDNHTDYMPHVCHELPIKVQIWDDNVYGNEVMTLDAWDASRWTGSSANDNESWQHWWCVDVPEAYSASSPLYERMEKSLRLRMGDVPYDMMVELIKRKQPKVDPMPGAVTNGGRPLLPLLVGNRTPKRPDQNFEDHLARMKNNNKE